MKVRCRPSFVKVGTDNKLLFVQLWDKNKVLLLAKV